MLVLTRKQDEAVVIDGRVTIRVLRVKGRSILLGIEAPPDVPIRRGKLRPSTCPVDASRRPHERR